MTDPIDLDAAREERDRERQIEEAAHVARVAILAAIATEAQRIQADRERNPVNLSVLKDALGVVCGLYIEE